MIMDIRKESIDRAPAEIFLITGCDVDELAEVDWNEVTWCDHKADKGIRYVREDLIHSNAEVSHGANN